jgi:hypothetical protein
MSRPFTGRILCCGPSDPPEALGPFLLGLAEIGIDESVLWCSCLWQERIK